MDRRHKPHKPFTIPVEQMETSSLYQDTYVAKDMRDRARPIVPQGEFQPPNDQREMISEHTAGYQEKAVSSSSLSA